MLVFARPARASAIGCARGDGEPRLSRFFKSEQTRASGQRRAIGAALNVTGSGDLFGHSFLKHRLTKRGELLRAGLGGARKVHAAVEIVLFAERRLKFRILRRQPRNFF